MHLFTKIFAHIEKKQYLCTRFETRSVPHSIPTILLTIKF